MRIFFIIVAIFSVCPGLALAQTAKPVEALDLYKLEQPLDPQISPDGKQVAVLRQTRDIQTDRVNTELWLVTLPRSGVTSDRRLLVGSDRAPASPRWSPDGRSIAFIGKEGTKPQIFVLDMNDGRSASVTRV
jgi:Tol biopolymer transport system component